LFFGLAADAQLAELRIPRRTLAVMLTKPIRPTTHTSLVRDNERYTAPSFKILSNVVGAIQKTKTAASTISTRTPTLSANSHFRIIIQPMVAAILAIRAGLRDARSGRPAYGPYIGSGGRNE
jgi:hypothetical protein